MPSGVVAVGVWDCGAGAPMAGVLPYGRTVKTTRALTAPAGRPAVTSKPQLPAQGNVTGRW